MPKIKREDEKKDMLQRLDDSVKALQRRFDELFAPLNELQSKMRFLWNADTCCLEALGDVQETESEYVVTIDLPMVNKEDVKIAVLDDHLTVQAKMREEIHYERWGTVQRQIRFQSLVKKVPLPNDVDADNIRASFHDGRLELRIAKRKKRKHVQIE